MEWNENENENDKAKENENRLLELHDACHLKKRHKKRRKAKF